MTQNTQKPSDKNTNNSWTTTAGGHTGTGKDTDKSRKQTTTKSEWQEGPTSWNASPAGQTDQGKSGSVNKNK